MYEDLGYYQVGNCGCMPWSVNCGSDDCLGSREETPRFPDWFLYPPIKSGWAAYTGDQLADAFYAGYQHAKNEELQAAVCILANPQIATNVRTLVTHIMLLIEKDKANDLHHPR